MKIVSRTYGEAARKVADIKTTTAGYSLMAHLTINGDKAPLSAYGRERAIEAIEACNEARAAHRGI